MSRRILSVVASSALLLSGCSKSAARAPRPAQTQRAAVAPSPAATPPPALTRDSSLPLRKFDEVLALPDEQFDVAEAVLALGAESKHAKLSGDPLAALAELDRLAAAARTDLPENPDGIDILDTLYTIVLERRPAEAFREDRAEDYDLAFALSRKKGSCLSAGIKTLAVARRMGVPVYGAQCPGHFFLRYVPPPGEKTAPLNFDATRPSPADWRKLDDGFYRRLYRLDRNAESAGGYLTPLTDREVVAAFLASRSGFLALQKQFDAALADAERAFALNPDSVTASINAGYACESLGRYEPAREHYRRALELDGRSVKAMNNLAWLQVRDPRSPVFNTKDAERLILAALKLAPDRAYLHATHGEVKAATGEYRAAARALQEAMKREPKNAAYRARFMELRGRLREE